MDIQNIIRIFVKQNKNVMRKTIYKYPLVVTDFQTVSLPVDAEILTVQTQGGNPCMWALVDPTQTEKEGRNIAIFGTGHPVNCDVIRYISTFQLYDGELVFHVFEYKPA